MSNEGIITMFSAFQNALDEEKEKREVYICQIFPFLMILVFL